jgi:hypothetical protein
MCFRASYYIASYAQANQNSKIFFLQSLERDHCLLKFERRLHGFTRMTKEAFFQSLTLEGCFVSLDLEMSQKSLNEHQGTRAFVPLALFFPYIIPPSIFLFLLILIK